MLNDVVVNTFVNATFHGLADGAQEGHWAVVSRQRFIVFFYG